jgi:uncharacterized coiled-coil protein SlyX
VRRLEKKVTEQQRLIDGLLEALNYLDLRGDRTGERLQDLIDWLVVPEESGDEPEPSSRPEPASLSSWRVA